MKRGRTRHFRGKNTKINYLVHLRDHSKIINNIYTSTQTIDRRIITPMKME